VRTLITSGIGERLLVVLPLKVHSVDGQIHIDSQACNGLRLWLSNFPYVTLACPTLLSQYVPPYTSPLGEVVGFDRLTFVTLPAAYTPISFFAKLPQVVRVLRHEIGRANYLHFGIGGLWGDWASVAALIASRAGLPFAVWTDRVESQVTEFTGQSKKGLRRLYALLTAKFMALYERRIIKCCALGLFHGMDCYAAYSGYCSNPHIVHNIHVGADALISPSRLTARLARSTGPLKLAYAGRTHRDKGIYDWIDALSLVSEAGMDLIATWHGSGPDLSGARDLVRARGLSDRIRLPGEMNNHSQLLRELQQCDAFVFCHKTPESPRCLIEALMCGLPIVGYETDYPRDLIRAHGGGLLTPKGDSKELAHVLIELAGNRKLLHDLTEKAAKDGSLFTDERVFRHRSELMKTIRIV
jgi:glycosyltransferase involved in cell wall biosynthesis